MKKILMSFALAVSMIFTSCTNVDKNVEFLNSKDVLLITFGKEYSDLKQLNNYYNYTTESEISSNPVNIKQEPIFEVISLILLNKEVVILETSTSLPLIATHL